MLPVQLIDHKQLGTSKLTRRILGIIPRCTAVGKTGEKDCISAEIMGLKKCVVFNPTQRGTTVDI